MAVDDACEVWARADEAWELVKWVLAHDPTKGEPLSESGEARALVFPGQAAHDMPTIVAVYVFAAKS